jgi:hypothetical protein
MIIVIRIVNLCYLALGADSFAYKHRRYSKLA